MFLRVGILELNSNLSLTGFKSEDISKFVAQKMRGHWIFATMYWKILFVSCSNRLPHENKTTQFWCFVFLQIRLHFLREGFFWSQGSFIFLIEDGCPDSASSYQCKPTKTNILVTRFTFAVWCHKKLPTYSRTWHRKLAVGGLPSPQCTAVVRKHTAR